MSENNIWLVAGLGNPEPRYDSTRHNAGFAALDLMAREAGESFRDSKLSSVAKIFKEGGAKIFLDKPLTYMNSSGASVQSMLSYYDIDPSRLIVVHDDMDLEVGRVKVKLGGSAAGHNGIKSIDSYLGTPSYYRVRIGIGRPTRPGGSISWVLGKFSPEEKEKMAEGEAKAIEAVQSIISEGLAKTQERFNAR
ncbi:MAG: aminoacyl-tRNA hydrolase [Aeriscardovia sp.]|nr:aminoacyl-tRNA hydrolase [Aeriscardovia sp.]